MTNSVLYTCIFLISVFISAVSQILLKYSAQKKTKKLSQEYLNPYVLFAYGLFFLSTFTTMLALKYVPLSFAPILEASGFVFVAILGRIFLKETIGRRKFCGIGVILLGIFIASH